MDVADQYEVDPMSAASPDLDDATATELRASIASVGQLVPIVLSYDGKIIDGRKRYAACRALGIAPKTMTLGEADDPTTHAAALNLLRTHYSVSQRTMYAAELATAKRGLSPRRTVINKFVDHNTNEPRAVTAAEAAEILGVGVGSVITARRVMRDAVPGVVEAVKRGDLTVYAADQIAKTTPREEQPAVAARVIAEKGTRRNALARTLGTAVIRRQAQKPAGDILTNLWMALEHRAEIVTEYAETPLPDDATVRAAWAEALDRIIKPLRAFRRRLRDEGGIA